MAEVRTRVPLKIADCFLLALDAFMRRTGQGAHVSVSILELDICPDLKKLRPALARLPQKYPLLCSRLRRSWKTFLPYWDAPFAGDCPAFPCDLWSEAGAVGALGGGAEAIENAQEFLEKRLGLPMLSEGISWNARLDVIERQNGTFWIACSWSHRLFDGKGAELLLVELAQLCSGQDLAPVKVAEVVRPQTTLLQKRRNSYPLLLRFDELAALGVHSLGGPVPQAGICHFHVHTLEKEESVQVQQRVQKISGPLFSLPYFLACASRAHAAVFASRGKFPNCYVSGVPIQTRKRGARGPIFHNQVSVFFFACLRKDIGSLESAAAALKNQFAEMTRTRLDEAFTTLLKMMRRMPARILMKVVRWQFRGEINSFFYSHTGVFAPELGSFAGAQVRNAWHLPCLGRPPGTGIFFSERDERLTFTISWREGCLSAAEREIMQAQVMQDLLGAGQREPAYAM